MTEIAIPNRAPLDLAAQNAQGLIEWARSADAAYQLADRICATAFVPAQFKGKPVEAAAAMLAGAEVGLSPMASLRAFDVIQGVAAPRALTMRAIAQSHGHEFITDESTPQRCQMRGRRRGSSEWQTVVWTIQRATQLGLTQKDQWKKQPQTMLVARATTELVRLVAADSILGIGYSAEEVQDEHAPTVTVARKTDAPRKAQRKPRPALEPPTEPDLEPATEGPELRTEAQSRKLWALARERGLDADGFKDYVRQELGRPLESTKEITKAEAAALIDQLEALDPATGEVHDAEVIDGTNHPEGKQ